MRLALLLICLAFPATGQEAAQAAAQRLQAAGEKLIAAESARDRISALTETVQAYEDGLIAMREGLRQVTLQEAALSTDLATQREEVAQLLGVLSTIRRTPDPVLQAHPAGALGATRAGMMVADVTNGLQTRVVILRDQVEQAQRLRDWREKATQELADGLQGAQTARTALGQAMSERTDPPLRFEEDPVQIALLVAGAESLGSFANQMRRTGLAPEITITPSGNLPLPAGGIVLPTTNTERPGIRIAAQPGALVASPAPATVLFRGALLDYGNVVILEPTTDVLFILAGLKEVFVEPGEIVETGAPLGLMGDETDVDGNLTENAIFDWGDAQQTLYLEVREGQSPTNPDSWFALE
ncbi:murein hydrolase activator EnvC family protein [Loktanella agnita]|uniref:murein hydrolase activator EnvC family protein n=1 Tax=Loktanella agnita TaxID=287097 RepID=UPI00398A46D3